MTARTFRLGDANAESRQIEATLPLTAPAYHALFVRSYTIEGIEPYLRHALLRLGLRPHLAFGGYGTFRQDLDAISVSKAQPPLDAVLACWTIEELDPDFGRPDWTVSRVKDELLDLFECLDRAPARSILVQNFIPPFHSESGASRDSTREGIVHLNQFLREEIDKRGPRFSLVDCARLASQLGEEAALDPRFWYLAKAPYKPALLEQMAAEISHIARVQFGLAKKVLVLDCDNTLWGGVVGEDGLAGVQIDGHDYPGKAFQDFHKAILRLARRGIILALSSKNDERDVFDVLDNHSASLLKREDFAAWEINWGNKADGIAKIAQRLNVGLESLVFVDDSAHEIALVRQLLPQVTCLQTPEKHWLLPSFLARAAIFDTAPVTDEDLARTQLYRDNRQRELGREGVSNLEDYLASLQTVAQIGEATSRDVPRIAQLLLKTNQFNLTTRRLTAHEVEEMIASAAHAVFALSANDRFGDIGLVGVMIAERRGTVIDVTDFLLSCRALGRGLEFALVCEAMRQLISRWGECVWRAHFLRTLKNLQTNTFWDMVGFSVECEDEHGKYYILQGEHDPDLMPKHIKVIGRGQ